METPAETAGRLLIYCGVSDSAYTLAMQGRDVRYTFSDLSSTLTFAHTLVTTETPLKVYDELGKLIMETTLGPPYS